GYTPATVVLVKVAAAGLKLGVPVRLLVSLSEYAKPEYVAANDNGSTLPKSRVTGIVAMVNGLGSIVRFAPRYVRAEFAVSATVPCWIAYAPTFWPAARVRAPENASLNASEPLVI